MLYRRIAFKYIHLTFSVRVSVVADSSWDFTFGLQYSSSESIVEIRESFAFLTIHWWPWIRNKGLELRSRQTMEIHNPAALSGRATRTPIKIFWVQKYLCRKVWLIVCSLRKGAESWEIWRRKHLKTLLHQPQLLCDNGFWKLIFKLMKCQPQPH